MVTCVTPFFLLVFECGLYTVRPPTTIQSLFSFMIRASRLRLAAVLEGIFLLRGATTAFGSLVMLGLEVSLMPEDR